MAVKVGSVALRVVALAYYVIYFTHDLLTLINFWFQLKQEPGPRNNSVIPGYQGHVPRVKVNNQYLGKRITEQSREVFREEVLDKPQNNFSTTG